MPTCDICGEDFDTERGLHIHQSQKHDEEVEDVDTEEVEEETEEDDSGDEAEESVEVTSTDDEVVKEIEEETAGGLLGGFSRESILVGGAFLGIAIGLIAGLYLSGTGFQKVSPDQVRSQVQGLPGVNFNVTSVTMDHGVYEVNATRQVSLGGQTVGRPLTLYVSADGEMIYLQGVTFEQLRQQLQAQQQQQPPTNTTTSESGNATANATQ